MSGSWLNVSTSLHVVHLHYMYMLTTYIILLHTNTHTHTQFTVVYVYCYHDNRHFEDRRGEFSIMSSSICIFTVRTCTSGVSFISRWNHVHVHVFICQHIQYMYIVATIHVQVVFRSSVGWGHVHVHVFICQHIQYMHACTCKWLLQYTYYV